MNLECYRSAYTGAEIDALMHQVAGQGRLTPRFARFAVTREGQTRFDLWSAPVHDVVMVSLNGIIQHEYSVSGTEVVLTEPCQIEDDVACFWMIASD